MRGGCVHARVRAYDWNYVFGGTEFYVIIGPWTTNSAFTASGYVYVPLCGLVQEKVCYSQPLLATEPLSPESSTAG